jgi:hypothetical protein
VLVEDGAQDGAPMDREAAQDLRRATFSIAMTLDEELDRGGRRTTSTRQHRQTRSPTTRRILRIGSIRRRERATTAAVARAPAS